VTEDPRQRLRVAHVVCSDSFAGVERYITYVAPGLVLRGLDVLVVGGGAEMERELTSEGIPYLPGSTVVQAARRLVEARPFDLIHAHMTGSELAAVLAAAVAPAPIVATRHFAARRGRSLSGRLAAVPIEWALRREIATSQFVAAATGRPSVIVPNAVPSLPASTARTPMVLMAQRLEAEKEIDVGIRAWATAGLAACGWRLVVAGEGAEAGRLERLADELGVGSSVNLVGHTPHVERLLAEASIFVATIRAEGFGLSVVEAMSAGVPVIAAASGAHLETVGSCTDEWLFPPGDHLTCAALLRRLAGDAAARTTYGAALQAAHRESFTLENHVDRLAGIYREVASERWRPLARRTHGGRGYGHRHEHSHWRT
jgi:glycosyltransferase involved in cell wall biosynthesis